MSRADPDNHLYCLAISEDTISFRPRLAARAEVALAGHKKIGSLLVTVFGADSAVGGARSDESFEISEPRRRAFCRLLMNAGDGHLPPQGRGELSNVKKKGKIGLLPTEMQRPRHVEDENKNIRKLWVVCRAIGRCCRTHPPNVFNQPQAQPIDSEWIVSLRRACQAYRDRPVHLSLKIAPTRSATFEQRTKESCQTRVRYGTSAFL